MLKYVLAAALGVLVTGGAYTGWRMCHKPADASAGADDCCVSTPEVAKVEPAATLPAIELPAGVVDVKNTKCIVQVDDIEDSKKFVTYKNKAYRICCGDCIATFNKDPEKYVKALEADPEKFGLKKKAD